MENNKNITVAEKFALCAIKEKISINGMELPPYLVISMIIEMVFEGSLEIIDKSKKKKWQSADEINVKLTKKIPTNEYNRKLYDMIAEMNKDEISIWKIIEPLINSFSNKKYMEFFESVKEKMINDKLISLEIKKGIFKEKEIIVINENKFDELIGEIRKEFLEKKEYSNDFILLLSLLDSTGCLKNFFIKYEKQTLKQKIKEIRETEIYKQVRIAKALIDYVDSSYVAY